MVGATSPAYVLYTYPATRAAAFQSNRVCVFLLCMQVRACSNRDVQRPRPRREVPAAGAAPQAGVPGAHDGGGGGALPARPGVLPRREAGRRARVHDPPDGRAGAQQRVPHSVRPDGGAQRIQGKSIGMFRSAVVPLFRALTVFSAVPLQGPEQNALGNVLVACLLAGISTGVALDWLWLIGKGW